jgi:hypothetical protein
MYMYMKCTIVEQHNNTKAKGNQKRKEQKNKLRSPGIEPGSITWQATIITTRPRTRFMDMCGKQSALKLNILTKRYRIVISSQ